MQFRQGKPPVGVVYDCDMDAIDDVLALALLYGFDGKEEARVIAVSVTRPNFQAAAFCEVMGRFYAGPVSGAFAAFRRTLPVGMSVEAKMAPDIPMLTVPLAKQNAEGAPVYPHGIHKLTDTAEPVPLIRNAFTAQHDGNCIVVLTGPATNLAKVLELPGAKELIKQKVRYLSVMAGSYPEGKAESNVKADVASARKLFAEWPTPIIAAGYEVGKELLFPAASIETDFSWSQAHPVVDAYRAAAAMPYDAPTWDLAAVLHAVRPQEGYFKLSDPGTISVLDDGRTKFAGSAGGNHRYLILDPAQKDRILKTYREIASAKPVPRSPRFRPQQQQQQQQQKPAEAPKKPEQPKPPASASAGEPQKIQ